MSLNWEILRKQWISKEEEKLKEKRPYAHVDPIVSLGEKQRQLVFTPDAVRRFSFSPLLKSVQIERRRKYDESLDYRVFDPKPRPIRYAAHLDALIYSWYGHILNEMYGHLLTALGISDCVLAYRSLNMSTPQYALEVGQFIRKKGTCAVICYDIKSFFEMVPHQALKENWMSVIAPYYGGSTRLPNDHFEVFEKATSYTEVDLEQLREFFPKPKKKNGLFAKKGKIPVQSGRYLPEGSLIDFIEKKQRELKAAGRPPLRKKNTDTFGIPQGLPISGVLANIAMLNFDIKMASLAKATGGLYRRYSDDILLVVDCSMVSGVEEQIQSALAELGLCPNMKKREVRTFEKGLYGELVCKNEAGQPSHLQYLGIEFDGRWYKLRSGSLSVFHRNIRRSIARTAARRKELGSKLLPHRDFYRRFTLMGSTDEGRNFMTYARTAHRIFGPDSKIMLQLNDSRIRRLIKDEVKKRMA